MLGTDANRNTERHFSNNEIDLQNIFERIANPREAARLAVQHVVKQPKITVRYIVCASDARTVTVLAMAARFDCFLGYYMLR